MQTLSNFSRTASWLAACGKQPGNEQHLSTQIGCHLEEFCEFLDAIGIESHTGATASVTQEVSAILKAIATNLKLGHAKALVYDREMALDALCDCEVTGNGVAFLAGFDKEEADLRVLASNESKLNADGSAVILDGGKIGKSALYAPPDLTGLY